MLTAMSKISPDADEASLLRGLFRETRSSSTPYEVLFYSGYDANEGDMYQQEMLEGASSTTYKSLPTMWNCIKNALTMPHI
jgi:hypothetical protein